MFRNDNVRDGPGISERTPARTDWLAPLGLLWLQPYYSRGSNRAHVDWRGVEQEFITSPGPSPGVARAAPRATPRSGGGETRPLEPLISRVFILFLATGSLPST